MTNNTHKARAINKRAILARYDGKCPYPRCQSQGKIRAYQDMIVNGPLGWGHAECVNAKIHFSLGNGISICKTTQNQRMVTDEADWGEVTCKKCLRLRGKMQDLIDDEVLAEVLRVKSSKIAAILSVRGSYVEFQTERLAKKLSEISDAQLIKYAKLEIIIDAFVSEVAEMTDEELEAKKAEINADNSKKTLKRAMVRVRYVVVDCERKRRYFIAHSIK